MLLAELPELADGNISGDAGNIEEAWNSVCWRDRVTRIAKRIDCQCGVIVHCSPP